MKNSGRSTTLADDQVILVDCPKCDVRAGIRCTSLGNTGYRAIKRPHKERVFYAERGGYDAALLSAREAKS